MERIFNGSISLLSILIAVFTFAYIQFLGEAGIGRGVYQKPYLWLCVISGALVMLSGICALLTHFKFKDHSFPLANIVFTLLLLGTSFCPIIVWLLHIGI